VEPLHIAACVAGLLAVCAIYFLWVRKVEKK
jgi:hypothetical protein